jgi:DNA sulfur modification protein DndD
MSVFIKKIELKNWFNYKGEYSNNSFEFNEGINIIVAGNDIGKSKLHNAFRWIIDNSVILKIDKPDGKHDYNITPIAHDNISKVLNYRVADKLANNESILMGVRITFSMKTSGEENTFIATKEIMCKKDVDKIKMDSTIRKTLEKLDPYTNAPRKTVQYDFDNTVESIIKDNYRNFFLVQGESLSTMTPLKGSALRTTMNNIVSINMLDDVAEISKIILNSTKDKKKEISNKLASLSDEQIKISNSIKAYEDENETLINNTIPELTDLVSINKELVDNYRMDAYRAKESKLLLDEFNKIDNNIKIQDELYTIHLNQYIKNYISNSFSLSKLSNDSKDLDALKKLEENYKDFASKRRSEIDDTLDVEEKNMMYALEKSQPKPDILEQMLKDGKCYVCKNNLQEININYIKDKLIPFFRNEKTNNDISIKKYEELNEFVKYFKFSLTKYSDRNQNYSEEKNNELYKILNDKKRYEDEKINFIENKGNPNSKENDDISISTYDRALKLYDRYKDELDEKENELSLNKSQIIRLKNEINKNPKTPPELNNINNLELFAEDLKTALFDIRKNVYMKFASDLESKASERFNALIKDNSKLSLQKIKVDLSFDHKDTANFEIKVIDSNGYSQDDGGGASQSVRQLAVVFALIDLADNKILFPFIADAPTSNMSTDVKKLFFINQISETRTNQRIIITMDLWKDEPKPGSLNLMGEDILKLIKDKKSSSFTVITYDEITNNTIITKKI